MAAAASSVASTSTPVSSSAFSRLLRNTNFARFDPSLEQVYTSHGGHRHRGDYGLKRPLSARTPKYVRVKALDMRPHTITNLRNAGREAHFIQRFEEAGWTMQGATDSIGMTTETNVWRNISWFDTNSEDLIERDTGLQAAREDEGKEVDEEAETERFYLDLAEEEEAKARSSREAGLGKKGKKDQIGRQLVAAHQDYNSMSDDEFERFLAELRTLRPQFARAVIRDHEKGKLQRQVQQRFDAAADDFRNISDRGPPSGDNYSNDAALGEEAGGDEEEGPSARSGIVELTAEQERQLDAKVDAMNPGEDHLFDLFNPTIPSTADALAKQTSDDFEITEESREKAARAFASQVLKSRAADGSPRSRRWIKPSRHGNLGISYSHEDVIYNWTMAPHVPGRIVRGQETVDGGKMKPAVGNVMGLATYVSSSNSVVDYQPSPNTNTIDERRGEVFFAPRRILALPANLPDDEDKVKIGHFTADDARAAHDQDSMRFEPRLLNSNSIKLADLQAWNADFEQLERRKFDNRHRRIGSPEWVGDERSTQVRTAGIDSGGSTRNHTTKAMFETLSQRESSSAPKERQQYFADA